MLSRLLYQQKLPANLYSISSLRNTFAKVLKAEIWSKRRNAMLLCLTEATTNLVVHGDDSTTEIGFVFGQDSEGHWLDITDNGKPWDPTADTMNIGISQFTLTEQGRGIPLLFSITDQLTYQAGTAGQPNKLQLKWFQPNQPPQQSVLVVEDDPALRRLYVAYLQSQFDVSCAVDGQQALQLMTTQQFDLVLSDIHMPVMSGLALRQHLSQQPGANLTPFIFITANNEAETQQLAAGLGIDDYLIKPLSKQRLLATIERVLERSRQVYRQLTDRINHQISQALSPTLPQSSHGWQLALEHRHTGIGGGDLVLQHQTQNQLTLVLVDVMGHDDSAKFFSFAYAGYLRGLINSTAGEITPARLLEQVSEAAFADKLLEQVTFTCLVASLSRHGQITVACAGHPPPIYLHAHEGNQQHNQSIAAEPIKVGGMLPGLVSNTQYQSITLTVEPGVRLALYTDGLFESAPNNADRRTLETKITDTLVAGQGFPLGTALTNTMQCFDQLAGTPPADDTLLLLLEPGAEPCD